MLALPTLLIVLLAGPLALTAPVPQPVGVPDGTVVSVETKHLFPPAFPHSVSFAVSILPNDVLGLTQELK
jgi:hypothetical protein